MLPPKLTPEEIIGVDVFLEKFQTRIYVGKLERISDQFIFTYEQSYLKATNVLPLGLEFPLIHEKFFSKELFPSFSDRIPDPNNPAYNDYCRETGISPETSDPIILLPTIGKRGPSSFIFEPVYKGTISFEECEKFREQLGLSMQDFAHLFDISLSILQKIKAGETSGKDILKRIEHYIYFPEVLNAQLLRNIKWLHSKKYTPTLLKERVRLMNRLEELFVKIFGKDHYHSLDEAINLSEQIDNCYIQLSKNNLGTIASKKFNEYKKIFCDEIKPIIYIANYLKSIGDEPELIYFCLDKSLRYDGIFQWKSKEIRLEVTRALGGKGGGQNEQLVHELLQQKGIAPIGQTIEHSGNKKNRQFGENLPKVAVNRHKEDIPNRLLEALKIKNKSEYQECWLVITIPTFSPTDTDILHEGCEEFWKKVYKTTPIYLERILIISEEFIKYEDPISLVYNEIQNIPAYTRAKNKSLEKSVWDSHNDEHTIKFLLQCSDKSMFDSENGKELYNLLLNVADVFFTKNPDYLDYTTKWLLEESKTVSVENELKFFVLLDRILNYATKLNMGNEIDDSVREVFNHPVGDLTISLLQLLGTHSRPNNEIPSNIKSRLTNLLQESNCSAIISVIAIAMRLTWLFSIDRKWIKEHILKYLKWNNPDNSRAQHVWRAFIWDIYSTTHAINSELFNEIKLDFLEAIKQLKSKSKGYQELCYIFVYLCLCKNKYLSEKDCKQLFASLTPEQLEHISFAIFQVIQKAQENSDELWNTKIDKWLTNVWPQEEIFTNPRISDNLVRAAILSGSAFGKAEKTLSSLALLTISQELFLLLRELIISKTSDNFPNETLDLLDKIIPSNFKTSNYLFAKSEKEMLDAILGNLINNFPELSNDRTYSKLLKYLD